MKLECRNCKLYNGNCGHHFVDSINNHIDYDCPAEAVTDKFGDCSYYEETRAGEFMATVIGGIVVLLMMAIPPILLAGGTIALIWAIIQTVLAI